MMRQYELIDRVTHYDPHADEDILNRAYVFATKMHGGQKRASGDPYFSHPVEVAGLLTDLKLDTATIATALLHDTLEDTEATHEQLVSLFGEEIAHLVDGVTRLSKLDLISTNSAQAEDFRKFLTATANDIRVLLVKLADRLHNMRTLSFISNSAKRRRIAEETLDIYAPLAGRIGMQAFREELEDLVFAELNPDARNSILTQLNAKTDSRADMLDAIAYELSTLLAEYDLKVEVKGRKKAPFSIWNKMARRSISMEQLSDIYGYRIITDDEAQCYQVLGVLHRQFRHVPGRYKDYISTPKLNHYRSIHTTMIGPDNQRVEVQIRTREMDKTAENGVAAHWYYKDSEAAAVNFADIKPFTWLQETVAHLRESGTAEEFLEHTKLELYADQVFCFTPKGRLIATPRGACVLDFAYAVHTEIGHSCAGAYINGAKVAAHQKLNNGDTIDIIRDETITPDETWLMDAITGKARTAIRGALRARTAADYTELGRKLIYSLFASEGREASRAVLERSLGIMEYQSLEALYADVGRGAIAPSDVLYAVFPESRQSRTGRMLAGAMQVVRRRKPVHKVAIPVGHALSGVAMNIADDCFPLPGDAQIAGDPILGLRVPDAGVVIYPQEVIHRFFGDQRDRWVEMDWQNDGEQFPQFTSRLNFTLINKTGVLNTITRTIADFDANIADLHLTRGEADFCNLTLDIEVRDIAHVNKLLAALRGISVISTVKRVVFDIDALKKNHQTRAKILDLKTKKEHKLEERIKKEG